MHSVWRHVKAVLSMDQGNFHGEQVSERIPGPHPGKRCSLHEDLINHGEQVSERIPGLTASRKHAFYEENGQNLSVRFL